MRPNPQHIVLFHHFRRLLEAAAEKGIDVAPLKGAHLLTAVYPEKTERGPLSDVDFLVRDADWKKIPELMRSLGFDRRESAFDEEESFEAGFVLWVDANRKMLFEAHRALFEPKRFFIDRDSLWKRSVVSDFDGAPCRRLVPEDHFCHIAFHSVVHRLDNSQRALKDLEMLLLSGADPILVVHRAREWRVTRSVWFFLMLLDRARPDLGLGSFVLELGPPEALQKAISIVTTPDGEKRFPFLHHRVSAALLWPLLFDSPGLAFKMAVNHPVLARIVSRLNPE